MIVLEGVWRDTRLHTCGCITIYHIVLHLFL
jgi:hypothetical protein